jgi:hypothetical protein
MASDDMSLTTGGSKRNHGDLWQSPTEIGVISSLYRTARNDGDEIAVSLSSFCPQHADKGVIVFVDLSRNKQL